VSFFTTTVTPLGISRDVASTKVDQVLQAARSAGHPLQCVSEPVE